MLNATVSGSFHRHMDAITSAVHELAALGVRVLSPEDPRVVASYGEFWFVASDPVSSIRLVQDRHLESIRVADFVWLVCPDGYVGQSGSMEIGYAAAVGVPIFASRMPNDLTLRQYVKLAPSLRAAADMARLLPNRAQMQGILIDPHASIEKAHAALEEVRALLTRPTNDGDPAATVHRRLSILKQNLALPTYLQ